MTWMALTCILAFHADPDATDVDFRIARGIERAKSAIAGSPDAAESLRELARSLPQRATASLSRDDDGEIYEFDVTVRYDWLRMELDRALDELPDPARLQRLIDYAAAFERPPSEDAAPFDDTDYPTLAEEILSRREFQPKTGKNRLAELLSRFFEKLWEFLRDLIPTPDPISIQPPMEMTVVAQVIMYVLIAVGVILLIWVIVKLVRHYRQNETAAIDGERHPLLEPGESMEPDEHWRLAQTAALEKNYRRAIRHVLLSVILHLDRREWVHYQRHLTNREYGESIRTADRWPLHRAAHAAWTQLAGVFDRVWYGHRHASAEDFELAVRCRNEMVREVPETAEP
jgi:hypothetical protein